LLDRPSAADVHADHRPISAAKQTRCVLMRVRRDDKRRADFIRHRGIEDGRYEVPRVIRRMRPDVVVNRDVE
jgi:hypothetical protein